LSLQELVVGYTTLLRKFDHPDSFHCYLKQKGRAKARPFEWQLSLVPVHPWSTATIAKSRSLKLLGGHFAGFVVACDLKSDLLPFAKITHPSALDGRDMDENVLTAIIRLDEAKALGGIEPFHGAGGHKSPPSGKTCRSPTECLVSSERFRKGELSDPRGTRK
jgi:hypothetical protein